MSKLREIRKQQSLTQEELSEVSGVSIRTIQRIEKGLSAGSPHTIKTLAKALEIQNIDLLPDPDNDTSESTYKSGIGKVMLMNLSSLMLAVFPLGNIIFPSIIFFLNRKNSTVNKLGRKILSFQILLTMFLFLTLIVTGMVFGRGFGIIPAPVVYTYWIVVPVNILFTTLTAINLGKENEILEYVPRLL
ncbi:MAG: helix-turn-helix domain-containing protein [Balneolaceae bacterium]